MTMASSTEGQSTAADALEQGRMMYKNRELIKARDAFTRAARLAPKDPVPFSNISVVKFEIGDYVGSILFSQKALKLHDEHAADDEGGLREKIFPRLAKAYFYGLKLEDARTALSRVICEQARAELEPSISRTMFLRDLYRDDAELWRLILDRLPRYRPRLQQEPEYSTVGHDAAQTLVSANRIPASENETACLFGGIGDARNLFATLAYTSLQESQKPSTKRLHFTIVDVKPAVLARDLVMFRLLFDLSKESRSKKRETLVTLCYVFAAQVMPRWAYHRLQVCLSAVLTDLERHDGDLMEAFYIPHAARSSISRHIQAWKETPRPWYNGARLRELARQLHLKRQLAQTALGHGVGGVGTNELAPPGCEDNGPDALGFRNLAVMLPHTDLLKKHEPHFMNLLTAWTEGHCCAARKEIEEYLDCTWQPNVTLVDLDYENKREHKHHPLMDFRPDEVVRDLFGNIPFSLVGKTNGVLNYLSSFFNFIANSLTKLQSKVVIEVILGEVMDVFERLRHGILRQHLEKLGNLDPRDFPTTYDTIHMSNIPDYVGGPLSTFIHGLPILRPDGDSQMTSTVLRNVPVWSSYDQFLAEHLLLGKRKQVSDLFRTSLTAESAKIERYFSGKTLRNGASLAMASPYSWKCNNNLPMPWEKLMPRQNLERWLHAHFLKLCFPFPRAKWEDNRIYAPLNITIFFHLINQVSMAGYPAHWLCGILEKFCEGEIVTTARAPKALVMDVELVCRVYPSRKFCIKPFMAEFKTLLAIWRRQFPFGLQLSRETLPDLRAIREYDIIFSHSNPAHTECPHFALVLKKRRFEVLDDLRFALLDEETGDLSAAAVEMRSEPGIHVISTFKWKTETFTATFWLDVGVMEAMQKERDWEAYIWRTDSGDAAVGPASLSGKGVLNQGDFWA